MSDNKVAMIPLFVVFKFVWRSAHRQHSEHLLLAMPTSILKTPAQLSAGHDKVHIGKNCGDC